MTPRWEAAMVSGAAGSREDGLHQEGCMWHHWKVKDHVAFVSLHVKKHWDTLLFRESVCVLCRYLQRFDSELEQIELMNGIKGRQGRLHGAREAVIKQTIERERAQFEGIGFGESSLCRYMHTTHIIYTCTPFVLENSVTLLCLVPDRDPGHHQWKASENIQVSGQLLFCVFAIHFFELIKKVSS